MTPQDVSELMQHLRREEGVRHSVYQDHLGYWTIGVGRMVDERLGGKLSDDEVDYLLRNDISRVIDELNTNIPWWESLEPGAKIALASMCFQMGWPRLSKFKKMLAALQASQYEMAASEALDSVWAKQTPERAKRVAKLMEYG